MTRSRIQHVSSHVTCSFVRTDSVPLLEDATDIETIVRHRTSKGKPEMFVEWDNGFSGWFGADNIRSDVPGLFADYTKTKNPKGKAWEVRE